MNAGPDPYNIAAVRSLLKAAFTAETLWRVCQDRADFRPVLFEIGRNAGLAEMIDVLLEYCRTQLLFDKLIAVIRETNPGQYQRYEAQLYAGEATPLPAPRIPHNLPPRSEFVGREKEKARIHEALRSRYFLTSIDGIGGIGKTSLALEAAYECLHASQSDEPSEGIVTFGSFVWITAKDRNLTLNDLLDAIAQALDYPGIVQRPLDRKKLGVEKLLRERPTLLIVDNFEMAPDDSVRSFLRYLPEPSKALITTRERSLEHAWAISLEGLSEGEALDLIRGEGRRLGLKSLEEAEDRMLLHLHKATGGAPLALKWSVGQIKQRGQSLNSVLAALHEARGRMFEDIFDRSWALLSPDSRQVLMIMPLFAASASKAALQAASDVHNFALDEALGQLVEMSLVDATDELQLDSRRYTTHPLMRAFAAGKAQQESAYVETSHRRLAEYFLSFVQPYGGDRWHPLFARLELDLPNVLAVVRWCWEQAQIKLGADILGNIRYFMASRGYWSDLFELSQQAVQRADEKGDEVRSAEFRDWPSARLYQEKGDLKAAEEETLQALQVFERFDRKEHIARAKRNLARIVSGHGDWARAEGLFREALQIYESSDNEREYYRVRADLAHLAMQQGNLDAAYDWSIDALEIVRQLDDPERIAHLLAILSGVARRRSDLEEAEAYAHECLDLVRLIRRENAVADNLFWLAVTEVQMGKNTSARSHLTEAKEIYRRLDVSTMIGKVDNLLAELEEH
jgi:LuxR family glucitol operon transcriptional activator